MLPPDVTRALFDPHLHTKFRLELETGRSIELELVEIDSLPTYAPAPRPPFSLIFRAPGREHVPQRIYTLVHEQLGRLDIFLVPIGPAADGMRYQAVFN